jgi:hypothetical protein
MPAMPAALPALPEAANVGAGEGDPAVAKARAEKNYDANKDKVYDLSTKEGHEGLICATPQIDNNSATTNDTTRCGGAAVVNSLLLDGDVKKNGAAVDKMCKDNGVTLNADEAAAVKAMKNGKMTPAQCGLLQEVMMKNAEKKEEIAHRDPASQIEMMTPQGMTPAGVTAVATQLRGNGAYSADSSITFNVETKFNKEGKSAQHFTTTVSNKTGGETYADSWPNQDGYATLARGDQAPRIANWPAKEQQKDTRLWTGYVTLSNNKDGSAQYDVRLRQPGKPGVEKGDDHFIVLNDKVSKDSKGVNLENTPKDRTARYNSRTLMPEGAEG